MSTQGELEGEKSPVAIVVGDDKAGQIGLKWAVNHLLVKGQNVNLIYVNTFLPQAMGISDSGQDPDQQYDLPLQIRLLCAARELKWELVTLYGQDAAKVLIEYVLQHKIERLVLGTSSRRSNISRLFQKHNIAAAVLRDAPDFCTVYVISKGKVASMRPGSYPLPFSLENFTAARNSLTAIPRPRMLENRAYDEYSLPSSDISSTGRLSTDSMCLAFYDNLGSHQIHPLRIRKSSSVNAGSNFESLLPPDAKFALNHSADEMSSGGEEEGKDELVPLKNIDNMEDKMKRLELEMRQTMDMYHSACKDALREKRKIKELQLLRMKDELRLKEARFAKEEALAIVEEERAKCREAMERVQRAAGQEAREFIKAEREALKRIEAKMKLDWSGDSNTIPRQQSIVNILVVLCVFQLYFFAFK